MVDGKPIVEYFVILLCDKERVDGRASYFNTICIVVLLFRILAVR